MAATALGWSRSDGLRLARARKLKGHTQAECGQILIELGAEAPIKQTTLSNWETGKTKSPPPKALSAIREYCRDQPEGVLDLSDARRSQGAGAPHLRGDNEGFQRMIAGITGSPLLDDRQGRFIDGLIERLSGGPPLTDADLGLCRELLNVLGLSEEPD